MHRRCSFSSGSGSPAAPWLRRPTPHPRRNRGNVACLRNAPGADRSRGLRLEGPRARAARSTPRPPLRPAREPAFLKNPQPTSRFSRQFRASSFPQQAVSSGPQRTRGVRRSPPQRSHSRLQIGGIRLSKRGEWALVRTRTQFGRVSRSCTLGALGSDLERSRGG
jgi:hypothetical protein